MGRPNSKKTTFQIISVFIVKFPIFCVFLHFFQVLYDDKGDESNQLVDLLMAFLVEVDTEVSEYLKYTCLSLS